MHLGPGDLARYFEPLVSQTKTALPQSLGEGSDAALYLDRWNGQ